MNKRKKHGGVSHRLTQMKHRPERDALFICENLCSSVTQSKSLRSRNIFLSFASVLISVISGSHFPESMRQCMPGTTEQMAFEKESSQDATSGRTAQRAVPTILNRRGRAHQENGYHRQGDH
jgi:hypothetical protein